jgi:hypothetical protein
MTASNAQQTVVKRPFKLPAKKQMSLSSEESENNKRPAQNIGIDPSFVPSTEEEMAACLADPLWRTCSGQLYKIMVKAPDGEGNSVIRLD